jgi:hypothetical protein
VDHAYVVVDAVLDLKSLGTIISSPRCNLSRHPSKSPFEKTLGYFLQGIPVIFVEIETALRSNPDLEAYVSFYRTCEDQHIKDPSLTPELCRGYEHFVTALHEIRHFHDALLCRPLFEHFLLRNHISWCVAQLVSRIPRGVERIPIDWSNAALSSLRDLVHLRDIVLAFDEQYFTQFNTLYDPCSFRGRDITLNHLIETNAIVTELVHLYAVHGVRSTNDYYENVVVRLLDSQYTFLIECFLEPYGDLIGAMTALYAIIPFCLYSSRNPTQTFCELMDRHERNPQSVFAVCNPSTLKHCFDLEASLKNEMQNTMFLDLDGRPIQLRMEDLPDREFAEGLINFHSTMYECRRRLIDKYVGEFDYNAALYFERLNELPIPPMLFFPEVSASGAVKGVHEQEFIQRKQSTYPIAAHPGSDPQNPIVFAGLTAFLGSEPAIPFAIADLQLAYAYFYNAGFQGKTSFYTPLVDHMYEKLMREISRDEQ